jgi:preprotein translocase subunit SecA
LSVGQNDPLVEYRRRGQLLFEEMQTKLRHDVVTFLYHAEPIAAEDLERPAETELTRAARQSINNADQITKSEKEFAEEDFTVKQKTDAKKAEQKQADLKRKKARKTERKRRTQARKRK